MVRSPARLWACLWTVYIVWGSTYLAIRYMVRTLPPLLGSGARFLLAGLVFAAVLLIRDGLKGVRLSRQEWGSSAVVGIALLFGGNGLVTVAENMGLASGLAALVIASVPLWVVVFRRISGELVAAATAGSVALGFLGVTVLLLPGRPTGAPVAGLLVAMAAAFCWAAGSFVSGRIAVPADPVRAASAEMVCGGAAMLLAGLLAGEGADLHVSSISAESLIAFAYLVVFGSLLAFTAYAWLLAHAPISQVATYAYVNPVVAIALGAVFVNEQITPLVVGGAAVIVGSVAVTVRFEAQRRSAQAA
jgi:drug/metabolite transporter (DMT)-like permease